jgi:hypothetical protein
VAAAATITLTHCKRGNCKNPLYVRRLQEHTVGEATVGILRGLLKIESAGTVSKASCSGLPIEIRRAGFSF